MLLSRWIIGSSLCVTGLLAAACGLLTPSESYRYRVTIEVDTPQGIRTGSSVWETKATEGSGIPDTARRVTNRGEAVAVELPVGTLFALLRDDEYGVDYPHYVVRRHLGNHPDRSIAMTSDWKTNMATIAKLKPTFDLYPDEYPFLVRFRDVKDPTSVEKVNPADLSASFGDGVKLKRITIAVTTDSVTKGLVERLTWLKNQKGAFVQIPSRMPMSQAPFPAHITEGDFVMGGI